MNYKKSKNVEGKSGAFLVGRTQLLCLNVLILSTFVLAIFFLANGAHANSISYNDEVSMVPYSLPHWGERIMVRDDSGVYDEMKQQINSWQEKEDYAKNWNLQSTGMYAPTPEKEKKSFMMAKGLKYMDKRLAGEVKQAEEGSALHTVGQVQQVLQPNAKVAVSKNVRLKFKAQVLQMKGKVLVINPYVDSQADHSFTKNETNLHLGRDISAIGIGAGVDYIVQKESYETYMSKRLTDTITTKISSSQKQDNMAFSSDSDRKVEINYSKPF